MRKTLTIILLSGLFAFAQEAETAKPMQNTAPLPVRDLKAAPSAQAQTSKVNYEIMREELQFAKATITRQAETIKTLQAQVKGLEAQTTPMLQEQSIFTTLNAKVRELAKAQCKPEQTYSLEYGVLTCITPEEPKVAEASAKPKPVQPQ